MVWVDQGYVQFVVDHRDQQYFATARPVFRMNAAPNHIRVSRVSGLSTYVRTFVRTYVQYWLQAANEDSGAQTNWTIHIDCGSNRSNTYKHRVNFIVSFFNVCAKTKSVRERDGVYPFVRMFS